MAQQDSKEPLSKARAYGIAGVTVATPVVLGAIFPVVAVGSAAILFGGYLYIDKIEHQDDSIVTKSRIKESFGVVAKHIASTLGFNDKDNSPPPPRP